MVKSLKKFLDGSISIGRARLPKIVAFGVVGVALFYIGVAGIVSFTAPVAVRGDTIQHVDYVWRIQNGQIPRRVEGVQYPPFVELAGARPQAASANPPLFYILQAPFISELLEAGEWYRAILIGRAINILFGVLSIFALAWGGWVFGRKHRASLAIAVPAISALTFRFTRLNIDYALDSLLVFFTTLSLIFMYKILTIGPQKKYLAGIIGVSVLGMATKAPYIVFLLISLLAIVLSILIHADGKILKKLIKGSLVSSAVLGVVLLAIGWFYFYWNFKAGGSWFTARPSDYTGGRTPKSVEDVFTNVKLWRLFYGDYSRNVTASIAITSFATAGYLTLKKKEVVKFVKDRYLIAPYILLGLSVLGVFATQVEHAVGVGSINFRYMLPALLAFGVYLSFGLLQFKSARGQLVVIASALMGFASLSARANGRVSNLYRDILNNSLPEYLLTILIAILLVGLAMISASLFTLSKKSTS